MNKLNKMELSVLVLIIMVLIIPGHVNGEAIANESTDISSTIVDSCSDMCSNEYVSETDGNASTCYLSKTFCDDKLKYDSCNEVCKKTRDDYCDSRFNEALKNAFDSRMGYTGATINDVNAEVNIKGIIKDYFTDYIHFDWVDAGINAGAVVIVATSTGPAGLALGFVAATLNFVDNALHQTTAAEDAVNLYNLEKDNNKDFGFPPERDKTCPLYYSQAQVRRRLYTIAKAENTQYGYDQISGCETIKDLYSVIEKYYNIIKALAIAALIIFSLFDFAKVVVSGKVDEDMKKAFSRFSTRIVIACAILILPTLIQFILNISINYNILSGSLSDYWCDFAVIMTNYMG